MLSILVVWALVASVVLPGATSSNIPITLYTDIDCSTPSTTATNVTLDIGVCAVTPGMSSFHLASFPCLSGSVQGYVFHDTACGQNAAGDNVYYHGIDDCTSAYGGGLAAIMLSCNQEEPEQPSSFTTINVGPIATAASSASPVATGGGGDPSSSISSGSEPSTDPSPDAYGWDSLSKGTKSAIIVSAAVTVGVLLILGGLSRMRMTTEIDTTESGGGPSYQWKQFLVPTPVWVRMYRW